MEWRRGRSVGVAHRRFSPWLGVAVAAACALWLSPSAIEAQGFANDFAPELRPSLDAGANSARMDDVPCSQANGHHGLYFLEDYQYFKPMVADIRAPQLGVRHYFRDEAVPFTDRAPGGTGHSRFGFFDFRYGEHFPFMGWNFDRVAPGNCLQANGVALFLAGSAHSLLDMDTESHSVLNTDFRIGGGIQARFARHLALRLQYFHESTHIGDEYVLGAIDDAAFRRYNVSYEAWEAYLAADNYRHDDDLDGRLSVLPVYARAYGGGRVFVSGFAGEFDKEFEAFDFGAGQPVAEPLLVANSNEFQFGGELYWDCFELPEDRPNASAFSRLTHFQYLFAAGDVYYRDRYDPVSPERVPSVHLMIGATYGAYFRGRRTVQWALHRYEGVNPHGQFRTDEIDYWALSFSIKF